MSKRRLVIVLVAVGLCSPWLAGATPDITEETPDEQQVAMLRGVKGLDLVIESIGKDTQRKGLTEKHLRSVVELRLRKAGIRVLSKEEWLGEPGQPFLYVNVLPLLLEKTDLCIYRIDVFYRETVYLTREPSLPHSYQASLWHDGRIGFCLAKEMRTTVTESVLELVDRLADLYVRANPETADKRGALPRSQTARSEPDLKPSTPEPDEVRQPPAPRVPVVSDTPEVIESKVDGSFQGWEGETIVKLMNGQIWQQTEYHYTYHYAYMPDVVVFKSGSGYKMKVDGVSKAVGVERLK